LCRSRGTRNGFCRPPLRSGPSTWFDTFDKGDCGCAAPLIAELGSCFLCADLGIVPELEPRPDHAAYLQSWLKVLGDDRRAIFSAAAQAQSAVAYLHGLQGEMTEEQYAA